LAGIALIHDNCRASTHAPGARFRRVRVAAVLGVALGGGTELGARQAPAPEPPAAASRTGPRIERQEWAKEVDGAAPVRRLEVRNDHGDIRARFNAERRLEAFAVIQRLDPGATGVGFTVERRGEVVALTATYPPGRVQDADPDPPKAAFDRLDLTVYVPEGVALGAQTLRGMVEGRGLKSDVTAATLGGSVSLSTTGSVRVRTASGEITALLAPAAEAGLLLFESQSGSVSIGLPGKVDASVRAETAGPVASDFQLTVRPAGTLPRLEGRLGRGGRALLVFSNTGRVEIRRTAE
jgi:hypothetical protein